MGILVDVIIIAIMALSIFLGYKKGLVKLAVKLFALVIAIAITCLLYRPVANFVINTTSIDETVENAIYEKADEFIQNNTGEESSELIQSAVNGTLNQEARSMAITVVDFGVMIALFVISRIALIFITKVLDSISKLPIINQFNKLGGSIYGVLRGILIIYVVLLIVNLIGQLDPNNIIHQSINASSVAKLMYNNNILTIFFK